ncbi:MAG: hypothetical protein H7101_04805 [Deinococcales bacterium]|nr:hypothetical protein [Chitinophagaceae bacterium]
MAESFVMIATLKQELIDKINTSNYEGLQNLLNTKYNFFTHNRHLNVSDNLSKEDFTDLANLIKKPFGYETVSLKSYKKATERWHMK